ncbi:C1 family peptidase [Pedobacter heparinus]|uniref:C1 family peptidase n=1 Tax=Pedobacter heparinus TaxID=984 RepID=UPI002931D6BC|nr:C1 family peptidase [Pedobacter heparinus]
MKKLRPICLFIASISVISVQAQYVKGMDFNDEAYAAIPQKAKLTRSLTALPSSASIKTYAPTPSSQGAYGTCTSWAVAYCGRTIVEAVKNNWTDQKMITEHAYSPAFLFRMLKPNDQDCTGGSVISYALEIMKQQGSIPHKSLPVTCTPSISEDQLSMAASSKIKDYMKLFYVDGTAEFKIQSVKKSIAEKKPVVFGMLCPNSFMTAKEVWQPTEEPLTSQGGHAMCVVGYDDEKFGGAFEIQNSWGTRWGNMGYIWIKYADFARFTRYAYEFVDLPEVKPEIADLSGQIKLTLADGSDMQTNLLVSTRGLKIVPAKAAPGPLTLYKTAKPYASGTRFRIYISNNEPAFVYAISTDLSNEVTKIFPYEEGISAALTDKKNEVPIPDEDHYIEFDDKPGKDFLCVLYSREALNLNDLVKKIGAEQGSFSERVFKVIGDKTVDPKNIQFSADKIAFTGFSKGKSIVPMMVELEHK